MQIMTTMWAWVKENPKMFTVMVGVAAAVAYLVW